MGGRGQLSAEMLILVAVVLAVLVLVASQLMKTASRASENIDQRTGEVLNKTDQIAGAKKAMGEACTIDSDCSSGTCSYGRCI